MRVEEPRLKTVDEKLDAFGVSLRAYFERVIDGYDRLYTVQFKSAETATQAALAAQEKQTAASFIASEKAIVKAEDAQREYNVRSNEFRGQLDDQAKTLMPRSEVSALLLGYEAKVYGIRGELDAKLSAFIAATEKTYDTMAKDVQGLRESKSNVDGRNLILGFIGAAVISVIVSLVVGVILVFLKGT